MLEPSRVEWEGLLAGSLVHIHQLRRVSGVGDSFTIWVASCQQDLVLDHVAGCPAPNVKKVHYLYPVGRADFDQILWPLENQRQSQM